MRNFDDMSQMFEQMDRMIDQMRTGTMGGADSMTNLIEEDDEYVFVMDLPGFETDEIDLVYHDGHLKISAITEIEDGDDHAYLRHSRSMTETVSIPGEIVVEDIDASYHNGVLEVRLPMLEGSTEDGHHIDVR